MSKNSTNNFQRQFIRLAFRRLPHHIALYTASKLHSKTAVKLLDSYAKKRIIASGKLQTFSVKDGGTFVLRDMLAERHVFALWPFPDNKPKANKKECDRNKAKVFILHN